MHAGGLQRPARVAGRDQPPVLGIAQPLDLLPAPRPARVGVGHHVLQHQPSPVAEHARHLVERPRRPGDVVQRVDARHEVE